MFFDNDSIRQAEDFYNKICDIYKSDPEVNNSNFVLFLKINNGFTVSSGSSAMKLIFDFRHKKVLKSRNKHLAGIWGKNYVF